MILTEVYVLLFVFEHMIEDTRDLVSGGRNGFGAAVFGPHAAIKGAQSTLAATRTLSRHAKSLSRPIGRFLGTASQHLAARDVVVWGEGEPGGEMFNGRPGAHIDPGFANDLLNRQDIQPILPLFDIAAAVATCAVQVYFGARNGANQSNWQACWQADNSGQLGIYLGFNTDVCCR